MKNVLVTGGVGFIGTNLIKRLLSEGHNVISIDNYSTGKKENEILGCKYYNINMGCRHNHPDYLHFKFKNIDIVFHLAAKARIQPSFIDPEDYINTNFQGTYEIVKYCAYNKIPLIYAGSSSHHSGKFKNPYTFSKDMGEEIIQLYQKHFELKASIARFYNVYGPYQLTEGGYTTLMGKWLNNIDKGIPCEIYGDGTNRRDFTHVDDIVDGLTAIMDRKEYNHMFEFGRGKDFSVLDVARMMKVNPIFKPEKPGEADKTLANLSKAAEILDYNPKRNIKDYLEKQIKTYAEIT